jgi:hypothetical protein
MISRVYVRTTEENGIRYVNVMNGMSVVKMLSVYIGCCHTKDVTNTNTPQFDLRGSL